MGNKKTNAILTLLAVLILAVGLPAMVVAIDGWSVASAAPYAFVNDETDPPDSVRVWYSDSITHTGVYSWRYNDTGQDKFDEEVFYSNETGEPFNTVFFETYENDASGTEEDRIYFFVDLNSTNIVETGICKVQFTFETNVDIDNFNVRAFQFYGYDEDGVSDSDKYSNSYTIKDGVLSISGMTNAPALDTTENNEIDVESGQAVTVILEIPTTEVMKAQSALEGCEEIAFCMYVKTPTDHNLAGDVWDYTLEVYDSDAPVSSVLNTIWGGLGIGLIFMGVLATPNFNIMKPGRSYRRR